MRRINRCLPLDLITNTEVIDNGNLFYKILDYDHDAIFKGIQEEKEETKAWEATISLI